MSIFKDPTINAMVDAVDNPKMISLEPTSKDHSESARAAIRASLGRDLNDHDDLASTIYDLVADLLHLARENDIEPDYIIHMAQMHFDAEVEEEEA